MLDCIWNDLEAQTALRRMLLKEKDQPKVLPHQLKQTGPQSDSAPDPLSLKRIVASVGPV
jgi:hypothetical protein